ncbi:MAG: ABC transporter ATP-binding protein [Anaerolineae bacterium]|nr:ABC transporter ATP-binding protein [Anaerolineae bacterium]
MIFARELHKSFGRTHAVNNVNLQVGAGEIYGLVGPDGAGKTTLLRLLCGVLHPDQGEVKLGGMDMTQQADEARQLIGYLAQRFSLYEDLTIMENLRFFAEVRGLPADEWAPRSEEILSFVGLINFINRRAGQLSGGMKQKLGLAVALVNRPRVLLLDEPTTGVDPVTRQDFWQLIIRLVAQDKISVIVSTPYMDEASRCMRLGFMNQGQILLEGSPGDLRNRLNGQVLELRGQPLPLIRREAALDSGVEDVQMFGERLHLRVKPGQAETVMERLTSAIQKQNGTINELRPIAPQMEDVFIALLQNKNNGKDKAA